jgi:hypothetical protein
MHLWLAHRSACCVKKTPSGPRILLWLTMYSACVAAAKCGREGSDSRAFETAVMLKRAVWLGLLFVVACSCTGSTHGW